MARRRTRILPILVVLALLGAGGWYIWREFFQPSSPVVPVVNPSRTTTTPGPTDPTPVPTSAPTVASAEQPRAVGTGQAPVRSDPASERARNEVKARVDQIPRLDADQRNKLYESVDRAQALGVVLVVPFPEGSDKLPAQQSAVLVDAIKDKRIAELTKDPRLVLVILGYSKDKGVDTEANRKLSEQRAEHVLLTIRDKGNVRNAMYSVGMGSADALNKEGGPGSRVAEVWAVFP